MTEAEQREEHFRRAEASCLLESLDLSKDRLYQELKGRVIAGEIDIDEMQRDLLADIKLKSKQRERELAVAK